MSIQGGETSWSITTNDLKTKLGKFTTQFDNGEHGVTLENLQQFKNETTDPGLLQLIGVIENVPAVRGGDDFFSWNDIDTLGKAQGEWDVIELTEPGPSQEPSAPGLTGERTAESVVQNYKLSGQKMPGEQVITTDNATSTTDSESLEEYLEANNLDEMTMDDARSPFITNSSNATSSTDDGPGSLSEYLKNNHMDEMTMNDAR